MTPQSVTISQKDTYALACAFGGLPWSHLDHSPAVAVLLQNVDTALSEDLQALRRIFVTELLRPIVRVNPDGEPPKLPRLAPIFILFQSYPLQRGYPTNNSIEEAGAPSFLCVEIDTAVELEVQCIQVDPNLIPIIRASYTHELKERMGHSRPDQHAQLQAALKQVDDEESRMARLVASGKISEETWESLWTEWQDRRQGIRRALETMHQEHIDNLELALQIIARIGTLYNGLQRSDQKELLRQVVERVIVNDEGTVTLELRAPFGYLRTLVDDIKRVDARIEKSTKRGRKATKNGESSSLAVSPETSSSLIQPCSTAWIRTRDPSVNSRLLCR